MGLLLLAIICAVLIRALLYPPGDRSLLDFLGVILVTILIFILLRPYL